MPFVHKPLARNSYMALLIHQANIENGILHASETFGKFQLVMITTANIY